MEMEEDGGSNHNDSAKGKEKMESNGTERKDKEDVEAKAPAAVPAAIVPPPEHRAALEKLVPDLSTHYRELFDIFGESLSSFLFQGVPAPICDTFL
jgi:hypothetical protein